MAEQYYYVVLRSTTGAYISQGASGLHTVCTNNLCSAGNKLPSPLLVDRGEKHKDQGCLEVCFAVSSMSVDWVGYGYSALVATGGVIGYVKAGSVPSLAAGLLFGGLAGVGAYQISNDPKNVWISLATSGALTGVMGKRFYGSRKFMPAGLMAGASLLMVAKLGVTLLQKPQAS
ncbi:transmembrane protein 14C isoform X1 [Scophthalmus maximus]|nr:transmembrane protein 14C isoform X1 [Scophthalmus maximus]